MKKQAKNIRRGCMSEFRLRRTNTLLPVESAQSGNRKKVFIHNKVGHRSIIKQTNMQTDKPKVEIRSEIENGVEHHAKRMVPECH